MAKANEVEGDSDSNKEPCLAHGIKVNQSFENNTDFGGGGDDDGK